MKWKYREFQLNYGISRYLICADVGEIQKIIAHTPGAQYTNSYINEIVADGIRCSCDTKFAILERGFCRFEPLRSDPKKIQWADLTGIKNGDIIELDPEKTYTIGHDAILRIVTKDPRVMYIMFKSAREYIHDQEGLNAAFAKIPSREEALDYLYSIDTYTVFDPL